MLNRVLRVLLLLAWLALGVALILLPWSDLWEVNYFLYQHPALGFYLKNPYLRGAVSGLGLLDVVLALGTFPWAKSTVASRN